MLTNIKCEAKVECGCTKPGERANRRTSTNDLARRAEGSLAGHSPIRSSKTDTREE
jgi:hypothetical protein